MPWKFIIFSLTSSEFKVIKMQVESQTREGGRVADQPYISLGVFVLVSIQITSVVGSLSTANTTCSLHSYIVTTPVDSLSLSTH